jgi:hypothetical protein
MRIISLTCQALTIAVLLTACATNPSQPSAGAASVVPKTAQASPVAPGTGTTATASTGKLPKGYRRMTQNGQEYVCRREAATGSRTEIVETCMTQAEFDDATKHGQAFLQDLQNTTVQPPASLGNKAFTPGF